MNTNDDLALLLRELNRLLGKMPSVPRALRRPRAPAGYRYLTEAEVAERKADVARAKAHDADAELRLEVAQAMVSQGIAPHVAADPYEHHRQAARRGARVRRHLGATL